MVACSQPENNEVAETAVPATATPQIAPTPIEDLSDPNFIVIATDAPNLPYTNLNEFGEVTGFSALALSDIMSNSGLSYELVVTPNEGVLETIAAGSNKDFDAVMTNLVIPDVNPAGIQYTAPYLEVGQVVVVLVDNRTLNSFADLGAGDRVGVVQNSWGETAVAELMPAVSIDNTYENEVAALQSLVDEQLTAVVIDSTSAEFFTTQFPDQIKIIGGEGRSAWIQQRGYGLAVASDNDTLLTELNSAILSLQSNGAFERNMATLIPTDTLIPGEPRAGTAADELVIGMIGDIVSLDPSGAPALIDWEIKSNVMSGLYRINNGNELEPLLAIDLPTISDDGLEYTVRLRQGVLFSDGTELTAEDVKWSVDRARSLGSFLINDYLKDVDGNNFADDDAVQVVGEYSVKFVLDEPLGYFTSILATPAYFPISNECFAINIDDQSSCGGIGPYQIVNWAIGEQIELEANPNWPGRPVASFDRIVVRFFDDNESITRSLEQFQSIDIIWTGMPYFEMQTIFDNSELNGELNLQLWEGPPIFKSYLIFDHDAEPWDKRRVRLAAAYALDRDALAALFGGNRAALFSPIPSSVPGYTAVYPSRNLPQARSLLNEEGFSQTNPLAIEIWYVSDGRYSTIEASYANEIKRQLEETGIFQVTISGADFEQFRQQIAVCNYPAYLLGWPSPGRPANYLDVTSWTDFFVQNTSSGFCSNYENPIMDGLVESALEQEGETRLNTYGQIQLQWAQDFPTLDLLEENRFALSLSSIGNVTIDAMGLMHYESLTKE
ncbi:MAG: ABC transporter substrate-binding protein [Chloroflexota bacterium]